MPVRHVESTSVMMLAGHFIATHSKDDIHTFISKHPETDIKIAQLTAKIFAEKQNIKYLDILRVPIPFIITVIKESQKWFPGKVDGEKFTLIPGLGGGAVKFGSDTKEEAIAIAECLASELGVECSPFIGIALNDAEENSMDSNLSENISDITL